MRIERGSQKNQEIKGTKAVLWEAPYENGSLTELTYEHIQF
jgi:hypothetical protein